MCPARRVTKESNSHVKFIAHMNESKKYPTAMRTPEKLFRILSPEANIVGHEIPCLDVLNEQKDRMVYAVVKLKARSYLL